MSVVPSASAFPDGSTEGVHDGYTAVPTDAHLKPAGSPRSLTPRGPLEAQPPGRHRWRPPGDWARGGTLPGVRESFGTTPGTSSGRSRRASRTSRRSCPAPVTVRPPTMSAMLLIRLTGTCALAEDPGHDLIRAALDAVHPAMASSSLSAARAPRAPRWSRGPRRPRTVAAIHDAEEGAEQPGGIRRDAHERSVSARARRWSAPSCARCCRSLAGRSAPR